MFHEGKVLIVKREKGFWEFPKGHVERGESEMQTAKREVKEETNISYKQIQDFRETIYYQPKLGVDKEVVYFLGKAINEDAKPQRGEVEKAVFVTPQQAMDLFTHDNHKKIMKKAKKTMYSLNF